MRVRLEWLSLMFCCTFAGGLPAQQRDRPDETLARLERDGGRVIVGLRPIGGRGMKPHGVRALSIAEARRISETLRPLGFTPQRHFRIITAVSGSVAPGRLGALRAHPNVEYVQPDFKNRLIDRARASVVETTPYGITKIRASDAWDLTNPPSYGAGVKVGILDTGGDPAHEDVRYAGGYDGVTNSSAPENWADVLPACHGHGTHVAGTVAATRANDLGVVGVAPEATLYALKFFESDGSDCYGYTSSELAALDWGLENGVTVINMSFGKFGYDQAEHEAILAAVAQGVVFVAAAGNTGGQVIYPAANPEVIAVAATDAADERASFSAVGPEVDIAAPGVAVLSTLPGNQYAEYNGTSMASPHVVGVVALLRSLNPTLTADQVRNYVTGWAADLGPVGVDDEFGFGRVDAFASVTALLGPPPPTLRITRQPDGGVSGQPLTQQPVVQLVDANGDPIAQSGVTVSATIASGGGTINGMVAPATGAAGTPKKAPPLSQLQAATTTTDANGIAEFTDIVINGLGPHVLQFSAPGHTSVNSDVFTVVIPPPTPLTNGVPQTRIGGVSGSMQYWILSVPPEATSVTFSTGDGWGDPDLYVRRGQPPDFGNWDCASWTYTTYEYCSFSGGNLSGDWYVMLYAYSDFGDVTLLGQWVVQQATALQISRQPGGAPTGQLLHPQPIIELRDAQNQLVPQAGVTVTVTASQPGIITDATPPFLEAITDAQGRAVFDGLYVTQQGTHALTFSAPGLAGSTSQNIIVSAPLGSLDNIAQGLLGGPLPSGHAAYLDAVGNADNVFNLGDVMAYLDRGNPTGARATAVARTCTAGSRSVNCRRRLP